VAFASGIGGNRSEERTHPVREKNFNAGLRGVLFEARHYERMGSALWLFGWLVLRQTHQSGSVGWVLGGAPVTYREIEEETGFNCRTLERWMQTLRRHGYIETEAAQGGVVIRIAKAKKFPQPGRRFAEGVRKSAETSPQDCGASQGKLLSYQSSATPMGSSSVEDKFINPKSFPSVENQRKSSRQSQFPTVPATPQMTEAEFRARERRLLRAEREEAVRRELAVGAGPEVIRR
jgi:hypothetical protein